MIIRRLTVNALSLCEIFKPLDEIKGERVEIIGRNFIPLVKGGGYNVLSGRGGSGKSIIALRSMIHHLVLNQNEKGLGYFTEDDKEEVESRFRAICVNEHGMNEERIAKIMGRCLFVTVENDPMFKFVKRNINDFDLTDEFFAFMEFVFDQRIGFVILDPLKAFHTLNENDNTEMDFVVRNAMKPLATKTGACVLILHHSAKGASGARGASTITDSGRIAYNVDRVYKKTDDGKMIPDERFTGKVRLTIEKDNKNIFRHCHMLDANQMLEVFPKKESVTVIEFPENIA